MTDRKTRATNATAAARQALDLLGTTIEHDEWNGLSEGIDSVREGLELMASALCELKGIELGAAPLDEVLAELRAGDDMVETAAALIETLRRASYGHFGSSRDADEANDHRAELYESLRVFLNEAAREDGR